MREALESHSLTEMVSREQLPLVLRDITVEVVGEDGTGQVIVPGWSVQEKTGIVREETIENGRVVGSTEGKTIMNLLVSSVAEGVELVWGLQPSCRALRVNVDGSTLVWNPFQANVRERTDSIRQMIAREGTARFQVGSSSKRHMLVEPGENTITVYEAQGERWRTVETLMGRIYPLVVPFDDGLMTLMEVAGKLWNNRQPVLTIRHGRSEPTYEGAYEPMAAGS